MGNCYLSIVFIFMTKVVASIRRIHKVDPTALPASKHALIGPLVAISIRAESPRSFIELGEVEIETLQLSCVVKQSENTDHVRHAIDLLGHND